MRTNNTKSLTIFLSLALIFSSATIKAQQEIPDNIKDHISHGIASFESAKTPADIDKALAEFNEAEKLAPDFADVHYYLGKTYALLQGYAERAMNEMKKYLELYPDAPEKTEVTNEIARLQKIVDSKKLSSIVGVELMELPDGIYIRKTPSGGRTTGRNPGFSIQAGDKLVTVDKKEIAGLSLNEVLEIFDENPDARFVPVEVIRGGEKHGVVFERSLTSKTEYIHKLGEEDLKIIIKQSTIPVIALFWNPENAECKKYMPDVSRTAYECYGKVKMIMINVAENVNISSEYNVREIPTVLFFKEGKLFGKMTKFDPELFKEKALSIDNEKEPFGLK